MHDWTSMRRIKFRYGSSFSLLSWESMDDHWSCQTFDPRWRRDYYFVDLYFPCISPKRGPLPPTEHHMHAWSLWQSVTPCEPSEHPCWWCNPLRPTLSCGIQHVVPERWTTSPAYDKTHIPADRLQIVFYFFTKSEARVMIIAFYPNKIGQNWPRISVSNMQISHVSKKKTISRQNSLTGDVGLLRIKIYFFSVTTETASIVEITRTFTRVRKRCCLALGIARSYFLSFLRWNLRYPIGRHVSPDEESLKKWCNDHCFKERGEGA